MIVSATVSANVDLDKVYKICTPYDRKECTVEIRKFVATHLKLWAEDTNSEWRYPHEHLIADHLLSKGIASRVLPRIE